MYSTRVQGQVLRNDVEKFSPWQLVAYYLMAGWLYEQRAISLMTDEAWDFLCHRLEQEWETLPPHPHAKLIKRDTLTTATAQYLTDSYLSNYTKNSALHLARERGLA